MQTRTGMICGAACFLVLVAYMISGAETTGRRDRHPDGYPLPRIKEDCSICHLPVGPRKAGELKKKLSALCLDCHIDRKAPAEHKVDIVPSMEVKGLPLTDGMMTCVTCHDPHGNRHDSLLRTKAADLCRVCHPV